MWLDDFRLYVVIGGKYAFLVFCEFFHFVMIVDCFASVPWWVPGEVREWVESRRSWIECSLLEYRNCMNGVDGVDSFNDNKVLLDWGPLECCLYVKHLSLIKLISLNTPKFRT
jgi:hypothetical protein